MKKWFDKLEKREQYIVLVGMVCVVFYLVFGVLVKGLIHSRNDYKDKAMASQDTLDWMRPAVDKILQLKGASSGNSAATQGRTLAALAEDAAKQTGIRIGRFQPKNDNEAQVWLEQIEFNQALVFLGHLEVDDGLTIDDIAVSSANTPGMVNVRLKFIR